MFFGRIFNARALSHRANMIPTDKQKAHSSVMKRYSVIPALALLLSACSNAPIQPPSESHLRAEKVGAGGTATIPAPVQQTLAVPKPKVAPKVETYSVVVNNVRVQELLFALARDAKLNVDIHPGIEGMVTLNAIDQTLQQLLTRIAKQVDIRWELDGPNLSVMPDKPFLKTYTIDFVNMARTVKSESSTSTQIATATISAATGGSVSGGAGSAGGNTAATSITSNTKNDLMESLISNVTDMLKEEDKLRYRAQIDTQADVLARTEGTGQIAAAVGSGGNKTEYPSGKTETSGSGGSGSAAGSGNQSIDSKALATKKIGVYEAAVSVFANKETGVLLVRATSRQHEKVQQFIDQVMRSAKRQVLIEATIAEVELSDNYKQGINWARIASGLATASVGTGIAISQAADGFFTLTGKHTTSSGGTFEGTISLLQDYGTVKVLSSPKLSVMNNQTATLKVANNEVYFTMKADTTQNNGSSLTTYTTTPNSVTVGFIMTVTPQVSLSDEVTINVRPTITRVVGYKKDPNPDLAKVNVENLIPEIQTREMESIIKVSSGQIAVMGGLMQDSLNNSDQGLPTLSSMPLFGPLFQQRNDKYKKTELVIFLRPVVIKDASIEGDYAEYRSLLPSQDFFEKGNLGPPQQRLNNPWGATQ